jgi:beta-xylosidase
MRKTMLAGVMVLAGMAVVFAQAQKAPWVPDRGHGTYTNPVIHADYSDPDVVRVGDDYYLVASSFNAVPGLPILHSRDLVNWQLIGHALPRLVPEDVFSTPQHGKGPWAPAIRHHGGRFWIYYPEPDLGIYAISAVNAAGPWSLPVLVKPGRGLIDPCPFWDDDGSVYLVHAWARSRAGFANVLTLNRLAPDGSRVADEGRVIIDGDKLPGYSTLEGPKMYKRAGCYWIFAPAGGVKQGWQSAFRSRSITGPYEDRIVLAQGTTDINGPHQGAWVTTASGQDWFVHFQDLDAYGRVVHLQPMAWRADGWPVMGTDEDGDGKGEPVRTHAKPSVGRPSAMAAPPTSDEFDRRTLGLQWQWQANPDQGWMSLTAGPGVLRLVTRAQANPDNLWMTPNLLLQKWPAPAFVVTTTVRFSPGQDGSRAGLIVFGQDYAWAGLQRVNGQVRLVVKTFRNGREAKGDAVEQETANEAPPAAIGSPVYLRVRVAAGGLCRFSASADNVNFAALGGEFVARPGVWVGAKVGVFAVGPPVAVAPDHADWDFFRVERLQETRSTR